MLLRSHVPTHIQRLRFDPVMWLFGHCHDRAQAALMEGAMHAGKGKGFAFASFTSYADALRCVQLANQQVCVAILTLH